MKPIGLLLLCLGIAGCSDQFPDTSSKHEIEPPEPIPVVAAETPPAPSIEKAAAGSEKLTAENYLRIKEGMQHDEVRLILGRPTESDLEESNQQRLNGKGFSQTARDTWDSERKYSEVLGKLGPPDKHIFIIYRWNGKLWSVETKFQFGLQ